MLSLKVSQTQTHKKYINQNDKNMVPLLNEDPSFATKNSVIFFWAPWYQSSSNGQKVDQEFQTIAESSQNVSFYRVDTISCPKLCTKVIFHFDYF